MTGQAPYFIQFRWLYGDPIPIGLDPETRSKLVGQRYYDALVIDRELWAKQLASEPDGIWCSANSQLGRRGRRRGTWSRPAAKPPAPEREGRGPAGVPNECARGGPDRT